MGRVAFGVSARLGCAFGFVLLLLAMSVGLANWQRLTLEHALHDLGATDLDRLRAVDRWVAVSENAALQQMAVNKSTDPILADWLAPSIDTSVKEVAALSAKVTADAESEEEKFVLGALAKKRQAMQEAQREVDDLKKSRDESGASAVFDAVFLPAQQAYLAEIKHFGAMRHEALNRRVQELQATGARTARVTALVVLVLVMLGSVFAWRATRHIKRLLDEAVLLARRVAQGDLSHRTGGRANDEFGLLVQALMDMTISLDGIVREVRRSSERLSFEAIESAQGNSELSRRTREQSGDLQQTATSLEQLTETVKHNASRLQRANGLARQAAEAAVRGGVIVTQVASAMAEMSASSRRIEEIIGVIEGIAFQTNILALNAAAEAGRAGERGRGFAVVAGEVRALAGRSATAAKEIKTLIADSTARVQVGTEQVQATGRTMEEILESTQRVSELMSDISTTSGEQAVGITEINRSVDSLDKATRQNAALVERAATAAESMRQQAESLEQSVAVFQLSQSS